MALRNLLFVNQQRRGRSFADAAAVVLEFDADDVIAGADARFKYPVDVEEGESIP